MNGDEHLEEAERPSGHGTVSRRQVLAGSLLFVGGSSQLVNATTSARFSDTESASGTVRVGRSPTLNYQIVDETKNNNAEYAISYQVENVGNFDRIELYLDNNPDGQYNTDLGGNGESESYTRTSTEGTISTQSFGGHSGDTFEFIFEVYEVGDSSPVIRKVVTDESGDGSGSEEGEFGNENSTEIEWILVTDDAKNNNGDYAVYYELTKLQNFGQVRVRFVDKDESWGTVTKTSRNTPNGRVDYTEGGTGGHEFDIIVEVLNQNDIVVDDVTISDIADGTDPTSYGNPARTDSPTLDSFTVADDMKNNNADYTVSYQTSNSSRFGGVDVVFRDITKSKTDTRSNDSPSGTVSFEQGGRGGNQFEITVEVFETREGVTFPIDSGTVEDTADGGGQRSWPQDTN
ncbi:hypothetical protein [Halosimplex pelagicum]|uniref:Uncharacterized protein n=1 Tax=Halosimplex pelagicum TaxID=869886 RepID=A0A7D5P9K0_9EURY|nr:hypothetical protein [Halosimplex pelagicum]QLH84146.1 hypothetical protein HZS54_22015 [Halosimplex pelagicum]